MDTMMPAKGGSASGGKYTLVKLPYSYDSLEPWIDTQTMEIHHTKHHQTYVDKLNAAVEKYPALFEKTPEELISNLNLLEVDDATRMAIKNHGGGVVNHNFFWQVISPDNKPDKKLSGDITETFGSIGEFKKKFTAEALGRFGSGWAWLVRHPEGQLEICSTANQDSPLSTGHTPLIALDVWEHAYYIQYKWERAKYIENWWHILKLL